MAGRAPVEVPGERVESFAAALGVTLTDEDRRKYEEILDRIAELEAPGPARLWACAYAAAAGRQQRQLLYGWLMMAFGHIVPRELGQSVNLPCGWPHLPEPDDVVEVEGITAECYDPDHEGWDAHGELPSCRSRLHAVADPDLSEGPDHG